MVTALGKLMQRKRFDYKMTQETLARKARVTRQTVMSIEHGRTSPGFGIVKRLAAVLRFSDEDILNLFL